MTDIPVGSPPVPPGRHAAPGGWYPDPTDRGKERYWDGWQWSRNTRELEGQPHGSGPSGPPYNGYPPQGKTGPGQPGGPPPYQQGPTSPQQQYPPNQYPPDQYPANQYPQQPYHQGYPPGQYQGQPGQPGYGVSASGQQRVTADGVPLAGWWWRVLAAVVDWVIISVIAALLSFRVYARVADAFAVYFQETMRAAQAGQTRPLIDATSIISSSDQLLLTWIMVGVGLAYHLLFVRWKAATPGKMLCRLRIVPVDQGQHRGTLAWNTVIVRVLVWVLPGAQGVLLIFQLLDSLFPLWQPKRQALHDLAARTQVVKLN